MKARAYYVYYKNWKGWFRGATYYRTDVKEAVRDAIRDMGCYDTEIIGFEIRKRAR
jgi:hypothetical protein